MLRMTLALLLAMTMALTWMALRAPSNSAAAATEVPKLRPEPVSVVVAPGRVEARSEILTVRSELPGRLNRVAVEEGDSVEGGQVIAALDDAEYRARVSQAQSRITASQAALERMKNGARVEELRQAEAAVQEAEVGLEYATIEFNRRKQLVKDGVVSRDQLDQCNRDYRAAEARVAYLMEARNLIRSGARKEDIAQAEAEVKLAHAQLSEASALLEKTLIRAPISGRVLRRFRQMGESVETMPATPILEIADMSRLRVRAEIDEADILRVQRGQRVEIKADALGETVFTGKVASLSLLLGRKSIRTDLPTEKSDTRVLEALIDLDKGSLPLNMRVQVYFHAQEHGPKLNLERKAQ